VFSLAISFSFEIFPIILIKASVFLLKYLFLGSPDFPFHGLKVVMDGSGVGE
jgi:hypothetical protein